MTVVVLLQSFSAAQNNADRESGAGPGTTAVSLSPLRTYHDGSIRDIRAIGNRDLGCGHGLGSKYSLQAQIEMGRSDAQQVARTSRLITDPIITDYVNHIGQNLVRNSDAQVGFTFKIVAAEDVNAFSLPGGFIFIDSGLILAADNEAELAAVISHEIAHVAACHGVQELAGEERTNLASVPRIFRLTARRIAANTVYSPPVRDFESEADFLAVEYLYKAGYDPQSLASFFERINALQRQKPGSRDEAFGSDAHLIDRIKRTQREINTLLPPAPEYTVDTSDFQEIKVRLARLESSQDLDSNGGGRPIWKATLPVHRLTR